MKISLALFLFAIGCSRCSLDDRYFNPRKTDAYTLGYSIIPQSQVEQVSFSSNGNTIYGVFAKAASLGANTKTILYVHGNDKDIDKFWPRIEYLYPLGINILIYDFQGYGKSTGNPSLAGIQQNTRDALAYLKTRSDVNATKIILYAFSLGGIFALDLAANTKMPLAIITENIPASSDAMVKTRLRIGVPSSFLFNETFDNLGNVHKVTAPILMFHSRKDQTVPFRGNADALFDAAREPKTTVPVDEGTHSDLITVLGVDEYRSQIQRFFASNGL